MPTPIARRQLRSSSAHCVRKLAKSWQGGGGGETGGGGRGGEEEEEAEELEEEENNCDKI